MFKTEEQKAEKAEKKASEAFAKSPVGQARQAYADGSAFFEVQLNHMQLRGDTVFGAAFTTEKMNGIATDTLGMIEAEGWSLHTVNHVYVMTGQASRDKLMSSGQQTSVSGRVVGVYLFRRTP